MSKSAVGHEYGRQRNSDKTHSHKNKYQAKENRGGGEYDPKPGSVPNTEMTPESFYLTGSAPAKPKCGECNLLCSQKLYRSSNIYSYIAGKVELFLVYDCACSCGMIYFDLENKNDIL